MSESEFSLIEKCLVAILAATDALFLPDRDPLARFRHVVIYERRQAFWRSGVTWASERILPGLNEAGRKQVQRLLEDLTLEGLVQTFQPQGLKTLGVRLSEAGESRARTLVGLPSLAASLTWLARLAELERNAAGCLFLGRRWLPETALANVAWGDPAGRKAFLLLEEQLLPVLVRGWVDSNCSVQGHCWYGLTEAGRQQLSQPSETPPLLARPDAPDRREYDHRLRAELEALSAARPECERQIGQIPMPVCPSPLSRSGDA